MTTGQKWLSLLLLQAGLLGGAYAGGRYPEWKLRQASEAEAFKKYEKLQADGDKTVMRSRARSMLMEAALAARYGHFAMAFDRVIHAQTAVQRLQLTALQKDFDELTNMLIAQKPEVWEKILSIADKVEPPVALVPPELVQPTKPAAAIGPAAGATPPALPAAGTPVQPGPAAGTPRATAPAAVAGPAAPTAPNTAPGPAHSGAPDGTIEQSRASLLAAKELIIVGTEPAQIIAKIAHAQVLLEEGGHAEFAEQFATAIKALRAHEETKARTSLDSVLTSLRGL